MDSKPGVYACLRCKARKIKCDRSMPKCTPCERAGSSCLTIDPASGRRIPRGYIDHLEGRVCELEAELARARHRPEAAANAWMPEHDLPTDADGRAAPAPWRETFNYKALNSQPLSLPTDLPSKTEAESLLKGYFERGNAVIPVLHREHFITTVFEPIYGPVSPGLHLCSDFTVMRVERSAAEPKTGTFYRRWVDCGGSLTAVPEPRIQVSLFFLYMIFALSIVTDEKHAYGSPADGARMYAAGMCYYPAVSRDAGSLPDLLRSLQALLLRAVYGLVVPSQPAAWYATGTVMRMCIKMGLHNESKVKFEDEENEFITDMRRRLFWSSYYMDRVVSVYLGRPANIGDQYIHCELPTMADDSWLVPPDESAGELGSSASKCNGRANQVESETTEPIPDRVAKLSEGASPLSSPNALPPPPPPDRPSYKWVFYYMLQLRRIQHATKAELYDRADFDGQTNVREVRDKIANDLENWYRSLPSSSELFNFNFSLRYLEVNYYYTLMLLYRSSRGIPNPTVEETRRMLSAGTRVLTMYVQHHNTIGFVYSWAAVHNVLHAASSCLFGLYRTNILDDEYDLNAFEQLMEKIMSVVDRLKSSYGASPSAYGPLHTMMRVTLDVLRSRGPETWRKRARKLPNSSPGSDSARLAEDMTCGDMPVKLSNNTDGVQAFPAETLAKERAGDSSYRRAQGVGGSGSRSVSPLAPDSAASVLNVTTGLSTSAPAHQLLSQIGPLAAGEPFRLNEAEGEKNGGNAGLKTRGFRADSSGNPSRFDAIRDSAIRACAGSINAESEPCGAARGPNFDHAEDPAASGDNGSGQSALRTNAQDIEPPVAAGVASDLVPGLAPGVTAPRMPRNMPCGRADVASPPNLNPEGVLPPESNFDRGWLEPREQLDPMQPLLVPRAVSESLAPMIPGFNEDTQYNEFQVYDILDEISQYFDGYSVTQSLR